ncbi:TRAP transporter substrate-binding protein DctP [Treponema zioleckii]|uniref:TRAP transporter substrate-binding protein DctP n=1 Tax=Treponema zioleckii TaxID=331680 RepID=UPI002413106E|nr:TRAP transporter substrate-binding protein DctP [Treponema zioleckii]
MVLSLAETHNELHPTALADAKFAELVEQKTDGRIKIEIYSNGSLYRSEIGCLWALKKGDIAFTRVSGLHFCASVPQSKILMFPNVFKNSDHLKRVLNSEIGENILKSIETADLGMIGLCFYDVGARSFFFKNEVSSIDDIVGKKIRVPFCDIVFDMTKMLGAEPVKIFDPRQTYDAFIEGKIVGTENFISIFGAQKWCGLTPYWVRDHHQHIPDILLASQQNLNQLSESDLKIIKECAKEAQEFEMKKWQNYEFVVEKILMDSGCKLIEFKESDILKIKKIKEEIYEKYAVGYEDVLKKIQQMETEN